ncbi:hypothetical protein [Shewanella sp.]|uniref:hypothetical protein n=1 Tax=Shewanella sp. TaxID=50422 RepID=UPI003A984C5E
MKYSDRDGIIWIKIFYFIVNRTKPRCFLIISLVLLGFIGAFFYHDSNVTYLMIAFSIGLILLYLSSFKLLTECVSDLKYVRQPDNNFYERFDNGAMPSKVSNIKHIRCVVAKVNNDYLVKSILVVLTFLAPLLLWGARMFLFSE